MKERIHKYLLEAGRGVEASQILRDVLGIYSPNAHSSDNVLAGFLGQDPRFASSGGLWHLSAISNVPAGLDFRRAVVLHLRGPRSSGTLKGLRGAIRLADGRCHELAFPISFNGLGTIRSAIENHLLIVWGSLELRLFNGLSRAKGLEAWQGETLYLRSFAARVLKRMPSKLQLEDLASALGLSPPDEERAIPLIQYLNECWSLLLGRIPAEFCRDMDSLQRVDSWPGGRC